MFFLPIRTFIVDKKGAKFPVDRFEQRPDLRVSNDFSYFNYFPTPSEIIVKKAALPFIMKNWRRKRVCELKINNVVGKLN